MRKLWQHLFMFSTESTCVIMLRTVKLLSGGLPAIDEAHRILAEKSVATGKTFVRAARGKSPLTMALGYRRAVRNNLRRLSR
jgi:hypothetical protein